MNGRRMTPDEHNDWETGQDERAWNTACLAIAASAAVMAGLIAYLIYLLV